MRHLAGGWVGTTSLALLADGREVVVKQSPYPADGEADGLQALARAGVSVPAVLGTAGTVLVLERVGAASPPAADADWEALGRAIARMHQVAHHRYGWHRDNHAGRFPQANPWHDHWPTFFTEHRVRDHLDDPRVPVEFRRRIEAACDGPLPARLPDRPTPSLTHGDLWLGNTIAGRWVVDPEVCFADRELDLAYMQMSARAEFPEAFWRSYLAILPVEADYAERRPVLELHHRLLQVRHFGDGQLSPLHELLGGQGW